MRHRLVDELPFGFGWMTDERYTRTSHALADGGRVWLVDPVDVPRLDDRVRSLGEPAGVIQLLDRHNRDCASIAARLGTPHQRVPEALPGTPFELVRLVSLPLWREVALWWPERAVLATADAVGTSRYFAGDEPAGVHPLLRMTPPRRLGSYRPQHLLVGHGPGIHGDEAAQALERALAMARTGIPRWLRALMTRRASP
jgi:hypothetical protein